ncbi:colanic acid biosynthesis glycosyltransferase WcaI [Deinococcus indicus]|uniref:Colanic acid biosynthesis glycosyltransferase WcaI n=1 Tax=Deinococcus indicus TaxID=223556 RepID=A0A246BSH4_9DEIO|nr:WcaI family glycosyltransferase [Deinococcus indicus]OWL98629.1 colanic acid biosynthesis glycosyltransferase WcaI [Deinococcus indicus]
MKILLQSIYYDKSSTGIAKYSEELADWLSEQGHSVDVICAVPHYPDWRARTGIKNKYSAESNEGVSIGYVPVLLPKNGEVNGLYRVMYELLYTISSLRWWGRYYLDKREYDAVMAIHPVLISILPSILFSKIRRIPLIIHVQDLQVDAAEKLKIVNNQLLLRILKRLEIQVLRSADYVTTISHVMAKKLSKRTKKNVEMFPNWSDTNEIRPSSRSDEMCEQLNIEHDAIVVMYSGNMGDKQGLEIVLDAASLIRKEQKVKFVMCGDGGSKQKLQDYSRNLSLNNVIFIPLQPPEKLNDLLAAGDIHLIIQKKGAADLVMPSKLTNIAAAGRPMIVTADMGTTLYETVSNNQMGLISEPESSEGLVSAIMNLVGEPHKRSIMGSNGRKFAIDFLEKEEILSRFEKRLFEVTRQKRGRK